MLKKILQTKQRGKDIHRRSNNNKDNIHIYIPFSYITLPKDLREFPLKNRLWLPSSSSSSYSDLLEEAMSL
jgi:hypothetical protein